MHIGSMCNCSFNFIITSDISLSASFRPNASQCEFDLHRAMGLMQHHDATTGTEKQAVAEDYALRLSLAVDRCQEENIETLVADSGLNHDQLDLSLTSCPRLNISECEVSELADQFVIVIYNPLSRPVNQYVRVPVTDFSYDVYDSKGERIMGQMNQIPSHIKTIPGKKRYLPFLARSVYKITI